MGKISNMAIFALVAFALVSCDKNDKKKTENLAKGIATEYSATDSKAKIQKLNLAEVNATSVKFALDSIQLDSTTSISFKEITPVTLAKQKDTITLTANINALAKVYALKSAARPPWRAAS